MKRSSIPVLPLAMAMAVFSAGCPEPPPSGLWMPTPGTTFDWILSDEVPDTTMQESIDIDAFDATAADVAALQASGARVIAYLSVGTLESWRPDADDFPESVIGNPYEDWEGERWLDIRQLNTLAPILRARLDMIAAKGFDAVEPDNIDGFENDNTGFDLDATDTVAFCMWLANEAHERGLSVGQKNAPELVPDLVNTFDWFLAEDAFADNWYEEAAPYIAQDKAVFAVEYTDQNIDFDQACSIAQNIDYTLILKDRDLTSYLQTCS